MTPVLSALLVFVLVLSVPSFAQTDRSAGRPRDSGPALPMGPDQNAGPGPYADTKTSNFTDHETRIRQNSYGLMAPLLATQKFRLMLNSSHEQIRIDTTKPIQVEGAPTLDKFYSSRFGLMSMVQQKSGNSLMLGGSIGSEGQNELKFGSETTQSGNLMYSYKETERHRWNLGLMYSNNQVIGNNFPVPLIMRMTNNPDKGYSYTLGFPMAALNLGKDVGFRLSVNLLILNRYSLSTGYRFPSSLEFGLYAEYESRPLRYTNSENEWKQVFFTRQEVGLKAVVPITKVIRLNFSGGRGLDSRFERVPVGKSSPLQKETISEFGSSSFLRLGLAFSF